MMKRTNVIYWVLTILLVPALAIGSVSEIMGNPDAVKIVTSLGYPAYLSPFLGVARILALLSICTPKFPRLKEWAYAGLVFDVIGAIYSQIAVGLSMVNVIFPTIILGVIFGSYYLHLQRTAPTAS